jgi:hypothetical protein
MPMTEQQVRDFLAQFDKAREEFDSWPKWMQDAARTAAAKFPRTPGVPAAAPFQQPVRWLDSGGVAWKEWKDAASDGTEPRPLYEHPPTAGVKGPEHG